MKNNYKVIRQAISKELADFTYSYFLMKRKLPNNIKPHWNFGPLNKNCKKVKIIVKHLLERVDPKKNYIIKKSKLIRIDDN